MSPFRCHSSKSDLPYQEWVKKLRKGREGIRVESNRRHPFLPINPASGSQLDFYPLFILDAHVTCSRGSNLLLDVKQIFLEPLGT